MIILEFENYYIVQHCSKFQTAFNTSTGNNKSIMKLRK